MIPVPRRTHHDFQEPLLVLASVVLAAAAFTPNIAAAESAATISVPFDFVVSGKTCPSGDYQVQVSLSNFVRLTSTDGKTAFTWGAGPANRSPRDPYVVLKFDSIDGAHVLRSIRDGSLETSRLDKAAPQIADTPAMIVASR